MLHFFSFNTPATTQIYTLSLHDALPIWKPAFSASSRSSRTCWPSWRSCPRCAPSAASSPKKNVWTACGRGCASRSEEHTSELQSRGHLVCRLLLEKKKKHKENKT